MEVAKTETVQFKDLIKKDEVTEKFKQMMGEKGSTSFLLSVLNCVQKSAKLQNAEPKSILMAAAVAGTLNLPVDPSLGMAYIIPFGEKQKDGNYITKAQFQIGYKGLIELAHRSQQYKTINVSDVREGELNEINRLTGEIDFQWIQDTDERQNIPIIGYVGYFQLVNGFSKLYFMTTKELDLHAKKYSKTYSSKYGNWNTNRPGMSKKTVLKLLIDKFGPKSVEMQKAIRTDQAIVNDFDAQSLSYADNPENEVIDLDELNLRKEAQRVLDHITRSDSVEMLEQCYPAIPDENTREAYDNKLKSLTNA